MIKNRTSRERAALVEPLVRRLFSEACRSPAQELHIPVGNDIVKNARSAGLVDESVIEFYGMSRAKRLFRIAEAYAGELSEGDYSFFFEKLESFRADISLVDVDYTFFGRARSPLLNHQPLCPQVPSLRIG